MAGGLIVSQVLTPFFTTPVIYLLFDRLALVDQKPFCPS